MLRLLALAVGTFVGLFCALGGLSGLFVYAGVIRVWEIPPGEPAILVLGVLYSAAGLLILAYLFFRRKRFLRKADDE
jgi:hypothetical protein